VFLAFGQKKKKDVSTQNQVSFHVVLGQ